MRRFLIGVSALAFSAAASAASLAEDARVFGARESVEGMSISPSGNKVAILVAGPGSATVLRVADLQTGTITDLTSSDGRPNTFRWCKFASESKLVCTVGGIAPYNGLLVGYSRLMTIAADGSAMRSLGQKASDLDGRPRQYDGTVIDWLPGQDGSVLVARDYIAEVNTTGSNLGRKKDGYAVDRIDLASLKSTSVEGARPNVNSYMTDGRGEVRLYTYSLSAADGQITGITRTRYRTQGSRDWRDLGDYDSRSGEGWWPLAIEADSNSLFALKKAGGRDALYRIALDGNGQSTLVAANAEVDIDGVVRLGPGQKIVGYTFATDKRQTIYFDSDLKSLQSALGRAIPKLPLIEFVGASADGQKLLVFASADTNPGLFYRFDRKTKQLAEITPARSELANRALAPVRSLRVSAGDGSQIPAYLTLPPGTSGKNLPAVVLPHGGPSARDEWGFDWLAQFLAARGYAVIQPNYRGSAGFGDEWLNSNGFKNWKTSIGDITASAKYLVAEGIADPSRMAILGWSYGGYAALQSTVVEPKLYKAAVAIAPVTDLEMVRSESKGFTNNRLVRDFVGSGEHLAEGSPLQNVAAIQVPVLLAHGDRDANVGIAQSEKMDAALRSAGKKSELIRFKELDHQLNDSDARVMLLTRVGEFLDKAIGH
jgi:dipeptidyl aminopeptidase/acylaminoacyl peptidase